MNFNPNFAGTRRRRIDLADVQNIGGRAKLGVGGSAHFSLPQMV
jgi:hypothetical protein